MLPNLVIPMAGDGSRFVKAGFKEPKPMIEFLGKRMIEHVVDAFPIDANLIFIIRQQHDTDFKIWDYLKEKWPDCSIVVAREKTQGAACTVLLSEVFINNDDPLYIMNSDNIVHWKPFVHGYDGFILTFEDADPKWSFAKVEEGLVTEVAEKKPISTHATSGVYYWRRGKDFVSAAKQMIADDFRVNGEFYTAPVYNWNIKAGQRITIADSVMHGVGTPEDLEKYIAQFAPV